MFKGKRVNDRGPGSLPPRTENREEDEFLSERMWTREGNRCSKQCTPTYTGVPDVGGVWLELARNIRSIATVTTAVAQGDLTRKIEIQVTRVALEVGTQGILGGQARVESVQGTWADSILNVNKMASNLTDQVRSISGVTQAVALGDFSKQVEVDVKGEMLDLKMTVNSMVNQLSTLANEVTRVSLEVGTEGNLGGQAYVPDVQGVWKAASPQVRRKTIAFDLGDVHFSPQSEKDER
ncbi:hypothetical protein EDB84DRAFT_1566590 [Lactarius hengduanensis]|nr:hypothetical protein EDB84DRAFT_1566590 [Lactarius hengduanensis]